MAMPYEQRKIAVHPKMSSANGAERARSKSQARERLFCRKQPKDHRGDGVHQHRARGEQGQRAAVDQRGGFRQSGGDAETSGKRA
jgi:hypothetical protein